jgi:hypothetical protein
MRVIYFFAFSAFCGFVIYLVSGIRMIDWLQKRSVKINYFMIRLLFHRYAEQYKRTTLLETGRVGRPYAIFGPVSGR